jgi:hypothetical protein
LGVDETHPFVELPAAIIIFLQVKKIEHLLKKMHFEGFVYTTIFNE